MKKKSKKIKVIIIILIIIITIIAITKIMLKSVSENVEEINEMEIDTYFTEYQVKIQNITSFVKSTGEITSFNIQTLDIPNNSTIKEKYINDGDKVTNNQKLFQILVDGYYKNITSPINGMYFEIDNNNNKTYQIYDLSNVGIEMLVNENDVAQLSIGQKAIVKITALNKEIEGSIIYISKLPTDGKFKVKVKIEYTDDLKFGYGASIKVITSEKIDALTIPYSALYLDDNNKYYVIKSEFKNEFYNYYMNSITLKEEAKTYVEIGTITNNEVEITAGLNNGDAVEEWTW